MAWRLHELGRSFELFYIARSRDRAAFIDELTASPFSDRTTIHYTDDNGRPAIFPGLAGCPHGKAIYCCGPAPLVQQVEKLCGAAGFGGDQLHVEYFAGDVRRDGRPFDLIAARSGIRVEVAQDESMLDALARAGIEVPSSCLSGVCGTCLVDVVSGVPDHRDLVQTDAEKADNLKVALCCSRAKTPSLVVDA